MGAGASMPQTMDKDAAMAAFDKAKTSDGKVTREAILNAVSPPVTTGIATSAAATVKNPKNGEQWVKHTDMTFIDYVMGDKLEQIKSGALPNYPATKAMTPGELAADTYNNFYTIVLATVKAGAWRGNWAFSLVGTLVGCVPKCGKLTMLAIKGGPACDCEIGFIIALMKALGCQCEKAGVEQANGKYLLWRWWVPRPNPAGRMMVSLYQYQRVEYARPDLLESDFWVSEDYAMSPKLPRVAIVSAPVTGPPVKKGLQWKKLGAEKPSGLKEVSNSKLSEALRKQLEFTQAEFDAFECKDLGDFDIIKAGDAYYTQEGAPVADMFNKQVGQALSVSAQRAEKRGWRPEMEIVNGESNMDKYMAEYGVYAAPL